MNKEVDDIQIYSVAVVVVWIVVSAGTLKGVLMGTIFYAPCLSDLRVRSKRKQPFEKLR